ncbi:hypothetical protein PVAND_015573 [Polypedilum vanderplanki]|uniref:SAM domain-containing protein n=1 Tax=Polypedilum vanderplanki TaxID=319348 RepID=A0A9J6BCZ8_POLVA|nr:hypothetical protein PVAND_015573 [Polypedilum vanderplanki]
MVEDGEVTYKKTKTTRPKAVYYWTTADVIKWYRRHCAEYGNEYEDLFVMHDITGRALLRLNDNSLKRMGIKNDVDREAILKEILKQRLKTDIMEIKELENMNNVYENYFGQN